MGVGHHRDAQRSPIAERRPAPHRNTVPFCLLFTGSAMRMPSRCTPFRVAVAAAVGVAASMRVASPLAAQALKPVGSVSGGNAVALETRTVKRTANEIRATLRTTFTKPAKAPGGQWFGSRTLVAVRCGEGTVAVLENRYYGDAKFTTVASEKIVKIPGYAAPVPGSVPALALRELCPGK